MELQQCPLTDDEKYTMISEAAFFQSKNRDHRGDPLGDWLTAETEIEEALSSNCSSSSNRHNALKNAHFRIEVCQIFGKAKGLVSQESIKQALSKGTTELKLLTDFFPKTIHKASRLMRHETMDRIHALEDNWNSIKSKQSHFLANWKTKGVGLLQEKAKFVQKWTKDWRNKRSN